jgi:hypothetical protein
MTRKGSQVRVLYGPPVQSRFLGEPRTRGGSRGAVGGANTPATTWNHTADCFQSIKSALRVMLCCRWPELARVGLSGSERVRDGLEWTNPPPETGHADGTLIPTKVPRWYRAAVLLDGDGDRGGSEERTPLEIARRPVTTRAPHHCSLPNLPEGEPPQCMPPGRL